MTTLRRVVSFLDDYRAAFHDPANIIDGDVDVGKRVAFDGYNVCKITWHDGAELFFLAEKCGGVGGGGGQSLRWGHAQLHEPAELARVFAAHGEERIRTHGEADAGFEGPARGLEIAADVIIQTIGGLLFVFPSENGDVLDIPAVVIDCGDVEGAAASHVGDGFVVHVRGVLDGIGAGADGVARTVGTIAMNGKTLAVFVRQVGGRFDFVVGVGLESGDVFVGACRGVHFDDVHSGGDFFADHAHHFGEIIGAAARRCRIAWPRRFAGDVDTVAGYEHARANHGAAIDEVAHGDIVPVAR